MNTIAKFALSMAAAALLLMPATAQTPAAQKSGAAPAAPAASAPTKAATKTAAKTPAVPAMTDQQIADAKAKGLVWVNLDSKVYHTEGQFYGKTKKGKFMTKDEADKAGYRAAKESPVGKKGTKATTAPAAVKK